MQTKITDDKIDNNAIHFDLSYEHQKNVINKIEEFYKERVFCDVKLLVADQTFYVHKLLLVAAVPYFNSMFSHNLIEKEKETVVLKDIDPQSFGLIINFLYTSSIVVNQANVQTLLHLSTILQISLIQTKCCEFLEQQLDPTNCLGIYAFAELHGCLHLKKSARTFCERHFSKVVKEEEFLSLPFERVQWFLQKNELCVKSEKEVFRAALYWINHDYDTRKDYLPEVLSLVRLHLLSATYLQKQMETNCLISKNVFSVTMLQDVIKDIGDNRIPVKSREPSGASVIFCIGGYNKKSFSSYETFNPDTQEWKQLDEMERPRSGAGAVFVGGMLYLIGGRTSSQFEGSACDCSDVDVYDPFNSQWQSLSKLSTPRHRLGVAAHENCIYAIGGSDGMIQLNSGEKYDIDVDTWQRIAPMNTRRMGVGVAVLNGLLYAVGGFDSENRLATAEAYNMETNMWEYVSPMHTARSGEAVAALNGHIYAIGGYNGLTQLKSVERYCPHEDKWTLIAPMNECRSALSVAVTHSKLFVLGGYNGESFLSSVEVYDTERDEWWNIKSMLHSRSGAAVAVGTTPIT